MTMMERMDAIEKRLLEVEGRLRRAGAGVTFGRKCPTPGCYSSVYGAEDLCGECTHAAGTPRLTDLGDPQKLSTELLTTVRDAIREELARGAPASVELVVEPAVRDELQRELEEAAEALEAGAGVVLIGSAEVQVTKAAWQRFTRALRRVRFARARGPEPEPRADADGAISGSDSGVISGASAAMPRHEPVFSYGRWRCAHCGRSEAVTHVDSGSDVLAYEGTCPGQTPTGSAGGGSCPPGGIVF